MTPAISAVFISSLVERCTLWIVLRDLFYECLSCSDHSRVDGSFRLAFRMRRLAGSIVCPFFQQSGVTHLKTVGVHAVVGIAGRVMVHRSVPRVAPSSQLEPCE